ncbi:beta-N-acetylhexosaminidase [Salinibius halmophilus]|uniref:beta-N-acetylhexosaminidase n=1 Tax=Salinibius halmophilus TaxID=1853216 RepID=UPI001314CB70|nr:beta-N-acetylhexosaminidase [Salinibius halmophilus]
MALFELELDYVNNVDGDFKVALIVRNLSEVTLQDFVFAVDLPREMHSATGATFISQAGSHCRFTRDEPVYPGEQWRFELHGKTARMFNVLEMPIGGYIRQGEQTFDVPRVAHNLTQESAQKDPVNDLVVELAEAQVGIVPAPKSVALQSGTFTLPVAWLVQEKNQATNWLEQYFDVHVSSEPNIVFVRDESLADEAYVLNIDASLVTVSAGSPAGELYALVSLAQLAQQSETLACQTITDAPRFGYRGQMLDCSRHFHGVDTIKKLLEQMTWLKLNRFHWHLTDDEGWRLEIDAYPQLTDIGAWRGEDEVLESQFNSGHKRYGGYFTKDDVREVLAFAAERNIMVIPEIDIPGHARALIKSLPDLLVEPDDTSDYVSIQQYRDNTLNPALPATYDVLETIFDEVAELFPGPFIHIGADEVAPGVWEKSPACLAMAKEKGLDSVRDLQGVLLHHLQAHLRKQGKQLVGWEEAIEGDKLDKDATLCSWRGVEAGIKAANKGYFAIMCPAQYTYFDLAWSNDIDEFGVLWAGYLNLKTCYDYEPISGELTAEGAARIRGVQSQLWCEGVENGDQIDYLLFPRLLAQAETAWSHSKDWDDFRARLPYQLDRLEAQNVKYRPSFS